MSFLNKLFGNSNKKDKPNLNALIASDDTNKSIIELDDYICKLCGWGNAVENLTVEQKNFYFNQNLEREVNNGGLNQFFFNSSGDFAHETIISLNAIKAHKTAAILQEAISQFPSSIVPKNQEERRELLGKIEDKTEESWSQLDQRFYAYEDDLNQLNIEYVKQNQNSF